MLAMEQTLTKNIIQLYNTEGGNFPCSSESYVGNSSCTYTIGPILAINEEKTDNIKKLIMISTLKDDWNGNGAKAFSPDLISKVRNIILFTDIQPEVFPTACESIQLEYDKPDGAHMEIEVTDTDEAEVFIVDNTGHESLKKITGNIEMINEAVYQFYG